MFAGHQTADCNWLGYIVLNDAEGLAVQRHMSYMYRR